MTNEIQEFITYLRDDKKSSANTEASYRRDLQKAAAFFEEQKITDVCEITATNIRSYLLYLEKKNFSSATVSRNLASLHAFSLSVQNTKNHGGSFRTASSSEGRKEDAGDFERGTDRTADGAAKSGDRERDPGQSHAGDAVCNRYSRQ